MPSLRAQFFNRLVRLCIKRRCWGKDEKALARRARRVFGTPKAWQWFKTRGLNKKTVNEKGAPGEESVRGEWIEPRQAREETILYIHGGGFVSCSPQTHRPITAMLVRLTGFRVFSLDYSLSPEHRFPTALDEALKAYQWLLDDKKIPASKIALAGDSAGGNLVLSLLLRLRNENLPLPACAVCFSPWTDLIGTEKSVRFNEKRCHMFFPENLHEFAPAYLGEASAADPYASPIFDKENFKNLPPILFQVSSTELLLDDSRRIHDKIQQNGGTSELEIYDDIFHCWQMLPCLVPEARDALQKASEFIRRYVI